jgi:hypothetical protein
MRIIITNLICLSVFSIMMFMACGANSANSGPQTAEPHENRDTVMVDLKGFKDEQIIVYINGNVKVMVSYKTLVGDLDEFIEKYHVQYDTDLKQELATMIEKSDTLNAVRIEEDRMLSERLAFRLADILERGEAIIFNMETNEKVEKILVEHYDVLFHKLAGRGGRLFFLPDKTVFLEVTDWIS